LILISQQINHGTHVNIQKKWKLSSHFGQNWKFKQKPTKHKWK